MLAAGGYTTVMWNIGLADWVERPAEEVERTFWKVLERNEREGQRGGIVLLHDTHAWSVEGFARILASLSERNCDLLLRGEELYDIVDSLDPFVTAPSPQELRSRQARLAENMRATCRAQP